MNKDSEYKKFQDTKRDEGILRDESLKEDNFSSHEHSIESFGREISEHARSRDFDIPAGYGVNRLVVLPINTRTEFIYWELNEGYVRSVYDGEILNYTIRLYEFVENSSKELTRFSVSGNIGRYYLNYYAPNRDIYVTLGIVGRDGKFIELLKSNRVSTPSDTISHAQDEVWMSKVSDWMEVIEASLERISDKSTSSELIKEMEILKRNHKLRVDMDTKDIENITSSEGFVGIGSSDMLGSSDILSSRDLHINSTENSNKQK